MNCPARLMLLVSSLLVIVSPARAADVDPAAVGSTSTVGRIDDATVESRLATAVDQGLPSALKLLEQAVDVNSGTMNFEGVKAVGQLFKPAFDDLGFETRWVEGAAWGRAGHLVAERHPAAARLKVLLIGHLDTVFEKDSPFRQYRALPDSMASGPGVTDMKGGDVVMLLALASLEAAGVLDSIAVTAVLTGDEEKSGDPRELSRKDLVDAARWADVAIGFEDGDGDPRTAVIARRGSGGWILRTAGKPAHSSQIFREDVGSGAIFEAARILTAFHDSLRGDPLLTFNPGVIVGGTRIDLDSRQSRGTAFGKSNVVAESTEVAGDLRAITIESRERARAMMRAIVAAHLPHTTAEISFEDGYPPLSPSAGNQHLLELFDSASRDLGFGPVTAADPARAGAADISFTDGLVDMAMDGVGLMGSGGHTVQETADLKTLAMQAKRVALTLYRLAVSPAGRSE